MGCLPHPRLQGSSPDKIASGQRPVQQLADGQLDAAFDDAGRDGVAGVRPEILWRLSFAMRCCRCVSTVLMLMPKSAATGLLGLPSAISCSTSTSRELRRATRFRSAPPLADTFWLCGRWAMAGWRNSFSEHFCYEEDDDGPDKASASEEIDQGVTCGSYRGLY